MLEFLINQIISNGNGLSILVSFFVIFGVIVTLYQLRIITKSKNVETIYSIFKDIRDPKWVSITDRIRQIQNLNELTEQGQLYKGKILEYDVRRILDKFEWAGIILKEKYLPSVLAIKLIRKAPLYIWYVLWEFINEQRKKSGPYANHAQFYVKKSIEIQIKHFPGILWAKFPVTSKSDKVEVIDLIPEIILRERWLASEIKEKYENKKEQEQLKNMRLFSGFQFFLLRITWKRRGIRDKQIREKYKKAFGKRDQSKKWPVIDYQ